MVERRPHKRLGIATKDGDAVLILYPSGVFRGEARAVIHMTKEQVYALLDAGAQALEELRERVA